MARGVHIFEPGTELAGFRIEAKLADGGMGAVYLATQLSLDREIALKVLGSQHSADPEFEERFIRESKLAASLDHPNVLPVYDAGEADGELYLAMRYVDGGDLGRLLKEQGRLPALVAVDIVRQVARALTAAHSSGLIHRDVKPANILLGGAGHAYLADFGLARRENAAGLTRTGMFLGTPDYASPEQLEGVKVVDGRADVYSLGCVLFHCLAGQPPYVRESEVGVISAQLHDPTPQLAQVRPDLPASLSRVLSKAMAKELADRYATAAELEAALGAVLAELGLPQESGVVPSPGGHTIADSAPAAPADERRSGGTVIDRLAAQTPVEVAAASPRGRRLGRPISRDERRGVSRRLVLAAGVVGLAAAAAILAVALSDGGHPRAAGSLPSTTHGMAPPATVSRPVASARAASGVGYDRRVKLSFVVPATAGRPVTSVRYRATGGASHAIALGPGRLTARTPVHALVPNLANGRKYAFEVRVCNAAGCAAWSSPSTPVTPYGRPHPPTVTARAAGDAIVFSWSGGGRNGRPVARYQLAVDGKGWSTVGGAPGDARRTFAGATTHTVRARVVDTAGETSAASRRASATTAAAPSATPAAPSPHPTPPPTQTYTTVSQ